MRATTFWRVLAIAATVGLSAFTVAADETAEPQKPRLYPSPQAAFEAYRSAMAKSDWSAAYSCLTPDAQQLAVFEAWTWCFLVRESTVAPLFEKHHLRADAVDAEYSKRYKQKHGRDPNAQALSMPDEGKQPKRADDKRADDKRAAQPGATVDRVLVTAPPFDQELYVEALAAQVKDGAGFYEAAMRATQQQARPQLERIDNVDVRGDTASGRVLSRVDHTMMHQAAAGPPQTTKTSHQLSTEFRFRKVGGSWLLDQWDE